MIIRQVLTRWAYRSSVTAARQPPSRFLASLDRSSHEARHIESSLGNSDAVSTALQETPGDTDRALDDPSLQAAARFRSVNHQRVTTGQYGSIVSPEYDPAELISKPHRPQSITLELLMASQSHLGHATSLWNPMNSRYIFGIRDGIHIISLDVTASHLRRACRVVQGVAEAAGTILFVGTRHGQQKCVMKAAEVSGGCFLFTKWVPGTITNGEQILARCDIKAVDQFDRDIPGFEEELREQPVLKPDLVVVLNPLENYVLLRECGQHNIPTIGVIDTDADPTWVTYPIPANDDSLRCIQVIAGVLGRAAEKGKQNRLAMAREGKITYSPMNLEDIRFRD